MAWVPVEQAVAVPVRGADPGPVAPANLPGSIRAVGDLSGRHELHRPLQLRGPGGAGISEQLDAAVTGPDEQIEVSVVVPVRGKGPCIPPDLDGPAVRLEKPLGPFQIETDVVDDQGDKRFGKGPVFLLPKGEGL